MRTLSLAVTVLLLIGSHVRAAEDPASVARGQVLVQRHCAGCHAVGRSGASPNPASPMFRELHTRFRIDDLQEALAEGILTGHPAMPEFRFPPGDVNAILAYLRSIQTHEEARARAAGSSVTIW
jgi:cytochrome c